MPASYKITEPHPSAGKYLYSGRGGAGNTFRAPKTTNPTSAHGPASLFGSEIPHHQSRYSIGRGGAGNIIPDSERAPFSFDEELERQTTREKKLKEAGGLYHVGRGGAGNYASLPEAANTKRRSNSSASSTSSSRSGRIVNRISHLFA